MSDEALERLAASLRARLLDRAGADDAPRPAGIAGWVEAEAALLDGPARRELARRVEERSFGFGPLQPLLDDPAVDEIMVVGTKPMWVERRGCLEPTSASFTDEGELRDVIERMLAPVGRRVDDASPLVDARLPDGSRLNVVLPPLAVDGPQLTIRRFRRRGVGARELVDLGTLPGPLMEFLLSAVRSRCNVLVCGATGSGKTTTLGALAEAIGERERVVTIEDAAELRLRHAHVVRLEARPPSVEGRGEVTIRALVRNALRMRPDRILVGEVRGPEALDLLTALACGHDGSLSTVHAGSAPEALRRLETLALMAGIGLPHAAVAEQVADAIHLVVCQSRLRDGRRAVTGVSEVVRIAGRAGVRDLYVLREGRSIWRAPTGERLAARLSAPAA